MIQRILFGGQGWSEAKGGLDAAGERQRAIASNIANADTPGYQAVEVAFEEFLGAATPESGLKLATTRPGHRDGSRPAVPRPITRARDTNGDGGGVNDVSIEHETTEMAENALHFQALSQFLANKYRAIRDAIRPAA